MQSDNLDATSSPAAPPVRRSLDAPQLLIEMSDEVAARLWVRSLLERAAQLASPPGDTGDELIRRSPEWRAATHRISACIALYSTALSGSLPRKARRRLRELARDAERVHRAGAQLEWLAQVPRETARAATLSLVERAMRRQAAASVSAKRAARDATRLRDLAKSLGVYTTAVKLDDMRSPQTFAESTSRLLRTEMSQLTKLVSSVQASSTRSARRALASARRLAYILEPVHMHLHDGASVIAEIQRLQDDLDRLSMFGTVANAIIRGGRRAGAVQMMASVRAALFGHPTPHERDLRPELLTLAWRVHGQLVPAVERFHATWRGQRIADLSTEVLLRADELR